MQFSTIGQTPPKPQVKQSDILVFNIERNQSVEIKQWQYSHQGGKACARRTIYSPQMEGRGAQVTEVRS